MRAVAELFRTGRFATRLEVVSEIKTASPDAVETAVYTLTKKQHLTGVKQGAGWKYRWAGRVATDRLVPNQIEVLEWMGGSEAQALCKALRAASRGHRHGLSQRCMMAYNEAVAFPLLTEATLTDDHIRGFWPASILDSGDVYIGLEARMAATYKEARLRIVAAINKYNGWVEFQP